MCGYPAGHAGGEKGEICIRLPDKADKGRFRKKTGIKAETKDFESEED